MLVGFRGFCNSKTEVQHSERESEAEMIDEIGTVVILFWSSGTAPMGWSHG